MEPSRRISPALHRWIRPRWGRCLVYEIKPVAVEQWLRSLPLAEKSKLNLRSLLHLVFQHGRRWEITDVNPIDLVRQRGGRRSIPRVLGVDDMRLVLGELTEPFRTMVLIAACLGLRASEIMGLQWGDLNWEERTLLVKRSVVQWPSRGYKDRSLAAASSRGSESSRRPQDTLAA